MHFVEKCRKKKEKKHTEINIYYEQRSKAAAYIQQVQENDFLELLENKNGRGSFFAEDYFGGGSRAKFQSGF